MRPSRLLALFASMTACARLVSPSPSTLDASEEAQHTVVTDAAVDANVADQDDASTPSERAYCWISGPHSSPPESGAWWICPAGTRCGRSRPGQGWSCCAADSPTCRSE